MDKKPSVFIGSSSEGLGIAEAVQVHLADFFRVTVWNQGVFELSQNLLESLENALVEADFAILILTSDDLVISRKNSRQAPRDNVIFELGLFMGHLGRERTFFVFEKSVEIKLPSDLLGVTAATFMQHEAGNLYAALGKPCTLIKNKIQNTGPRPRLIRNLLYSSTSKNTPNLAGIWDGYSPDYSTEQPNSTLHINQYGSFVSAVIRRKVADGEVRVFNYEGYFVSGQLILFFEDVNGPGYIVGTMVLTLSGNLKRLVGRSTYYHHSEGKVVSTLREYRKKNSIIN